MDQINQVLVTFSSLMWAWPTFKTVAIGWFAMIGIQLVISTIVDHVTRVRRGTMWWFNSKTLPLFRKAGISLDELPGPETYAIGVGDSFGLRALLLQIIGVSVVVAYTVAVGHVSSAISLLVIGMVQRRMLGGVKLSALSQIKALTVEAPKRVFLVLKSAPVEQKVAFMTGLVAGAAWSRYRKGFKTADQAREGLGQNSRVLDEIQGVLNGLKQMVGLAYLVGYSVTGMKAVIDCLKVHSLITSLSKALPDFAVPDEETLDRVNGIAGFAGVGFLIGFTLESSFSLVVSSAGRLSVQSYRYWFAKRDVCSQEDLWYCLDCAKFINKVGDKYEFMGLKAPRPHCAEGDELGDQDYCGGCAKSLIGIPHTCVPEALGESPRSRRVFFSATMGGDSTDQDRRKRKSQGKKANAPSKDGEYVYSGGRRMFLAGDGKLYGSRDEALAALDEEIQREIDEAQEDRGGRDQARDKIDTSEGVTVLPKADPVVAAVKSAETQILKDQRSEADKKLSAELAQVRADEALKREKFECERKEMKALFDAERVRLHRAHAEQLKHVEEKIQETRAERAKALEEAQSQIKLLQEEVEKVRKAAAEKQAELTANANKTLTEAFKVVAGATRSAGRSRSPPKAAKVQTTDQNRVDDGFSVEPAKVENAFCAVGKVEDGKFSAIASGVCVVVGKPGKRYLVTAAHAVKDLPVGCAAFVRFQKTNHATKLLRLDLDQDVAFFEPISSMKSIRCAKADVKVTRAYVCWVGDEGGLELSSVEFARECNKPGTKRRVLAFNRGETAPGASGGAYIVKENGQYLFIALHQAADPEGSGGCLYGLPTRGLDFPDAAL